MIKQNPVSFIGSTKRITRLARGRRGWGKFGMVILVALLLLLAWVGVAVVYSLVFGSLIGIFVWMAYTLGRRHALYRNQSLDASLGQRTVIS
jgi:hypothetical protein